MWIEDKYLKSDRNIVDRNIIHCTNKVFLSFTETQR